jgi:hypothetical protein
VRRSANHEKKFYLFLVILVSTGAIAQEDVWVYFKDRASYFECSLRDASQRALDRRTNQNIAFRHPGCSY